MIRHVQDYGSIILIDERYNWQANRSQISRWLRDRVKVFGNTEDLKGSLETFFSDMAAKKFVPKVEQLAQIQLEIDVEEEKKASGKVSRLGKIKEVSSSEDLLGSSNDVKSIQDISHDNDEGQEPEYYRQIYAGSGAAAKGGKVLIADKRSTITRFFKTGGEVLKAKQKRTASEVTSDVSGKPGRVSPKLRPSKMKIVPT